MDSMLVAECEDIIVEPILVPVCGILTATNKTARHVSIQIEDRCKLGLVKNSV